MCVHTHSETWKSRCIYKEANAWTVEHFLDAEATVHATCTQEEGAFCPVEYSALPSTLAFEAFKNAAKTSSEQTGEYLD